MPVLVSNQQVEISLRRSLEEQGFQLSAERRNGETGVDILARRNGDEVHIEVIGLKKSNPARAKDFFESFFRAISRLDDKAPKCVIALPREFEIGLRQRAQEHYRVAWSRIGRAFPELEIWLVDTENESYRRTAWLDWLNVEYYRLPSAQQRELALQRLLSMNLPVGDWEQIESETMGGAVE